MKCEALGLDCSEEAKWKVPLFGDKAPHCLCDVHVETWRANEQTVKAIDDDTPWVNEARGYYRDSRVKPG